jgi:hypothetical protein
MEGMEKKGTTRRAHAKDIDLVSITCISQYYYITLSFINIHKLIDKTRVLLLRNWPLLLWAFFIASELGLGVGRNAFS